MKKMTYEDAVRHCEGMADESFFGLPGNPDSDAILTLVLAFRSATTTDAVKRSGAMQDGLAWKAAQIGVTRKQANKMSSVMRRLSISGLSMVAPE